MKLQTNSCTQETSFTWTVLASNPTTSPVHRTKCHFSKISKKKTMQKLLKLATVPESLDSTSPVRQDGWVAWTSLLLATWVDSSPARSSFPSGRCQRCDETAFKHMQTSSTVVNINHDPAQRTSGWHTNTSTQSSISTGTTTFDIQQEYNAPQSTSNTQPCEARVWATSNRYELFPTGLRSRLSRL